MSAAKTRKAVARQAVQDRADEVSVGLRGARAAIMTTVIALEGKSQIEADVAINLRLAALRQIDAALEFMEATNGE